MHAYVCVQGVCMGVCGVRMCVHGVCIGVCMCVCACMSVQTRACKHVCTYVHASVQAYTQCGCLINSLYMQQTIGRIS